MFEEIQGLCEKYDLNRYQFTRHFLAKGEFIHS